MANAIRARDIDLQTLRITAPKTLDNGGKMMYVNYGEGISKLYLTTPEVSLPFDASYFADNTGDSGKYSVKISLKGMETNTPVKEFHDKLVEMDQYLVNKACQNSQSWFKKAKMSKDAVEALYTPMVKVSTDPETGEPNGKYPPSCGFKIVKKGGKFPEFSIYDNQKNVFDVDHSTDNPMDIEKLLVKGALVKGVLRCNGVWVANGKFGCTWRADQIRIKIPEGGLRDFAILSDSDDEGDVVKEAKPTIIMEDSDSSDEEVDDSKGVDVSKEVDTSKEVDVAKEEPKDKPLKKVRKVRVKKDDA